LIKRRKQENMTKDKLIKLLQRLLDTKDNLDFLLELKTEDLEKLVAIVREKVER
jgi:molecular chaperone GrpE (heat shock protein)